MAARPFRMAVQWVNRPDLDFRGLSGTVASGRVAAGDPVVVAASGRATSIARIVTADGDLACATAGDAVTLTFSEEVDASRGDLISAPDARPEVADQFAAHVVWMNEAPLFPGRPLLLKAGTRTVTATVSEIKHRVDVNSLSHLAAKELHLNEIAFCNLSLSAPIAFDPYEANRETGGFILIDRLTNATLGAGMIAFGLRRASNIHWQALDVDKGARAALKRQKPAILWFTGLSGAGKSTIANLVERKLHAEGRHTYVLDGDNVRHGLNRDLGFTEADRVENIRRVAETAKLFVEAGLIVLVSFISPFRAERRMARDLVAEGEFIEVFVDAPIEECRRRDPKGLYAKADRGQIKNFTGIDSPYEAPEHPEMRVDTTADAPEVLAARIVGELRARGIIA
jgi:bifunctional enzyme CysN/CysC